MICGFFPFHLPNPEALINLWQCVVLSIKDYVELM